MKNVEKVALGILGGVLTYAGIEGLNNIMDNSSDFVNTQEESRVEQGHINTTIGYNEHGHGIVDRQYIRSRDGEILWQSSYTAQFLEIEEGEFVRRDPNSRYVAIPNDVDPRFVHPMVQGTMDLGENFNPLEQSTPICLESLLDKTIIDNQGRTVTPYCEAIVENEYQAEELGQNRYVGTNPVLVDESNVLNMPREIDESELGRLNNHSYESRLMFGAR